MTHDKEVNTLIIGMKYLYFPPDTVQGAGGASPRSRGSRTGGVAHDELNGYVQGAREAAHRRCVVRRGGRGRQIQHRLGETQMSTRERRAVTQWVAWGYMIFCIAIVVALIWSLA